MPNKGLKFRELVAYFKQLATEHVDLLHNDTTNKRFYRLELDEILTGMQSAKSFPALVLEGYSFSFDDKQSDNPAKLRHGAFVLVDSVSDPGDFDRIHEVWDELESIGDDILARIKVDKRDRTSPVRSFNFESVEANLIGTEYGNLYGIRYTFTIESTFLSDVDESRWNRT